MPEITHDWDDKDYVDTLNAAYAEYARACYGGRPLPLVQVRETKQAFLSGIHWLATQESYDPEELEAALRKILSEHNPFIEPR